MDKAIDSKIREEIYRIIDSFLVEAKDQNSNDRSLQRLNQDRHLAVEELLSLFTSEMEKSKSELRSRVEGMRVHQSNGFTLMFGQPPTPEWIKTDKWHALIITSDGVYWDGELIAEGKLKRTKRK